MKILILASNPRKDLNLDREIRDLKEVIEKSRKRAQFEVETELAVRVEDLQVLLFEHQPQIVHFCGHGSGREGLVFEGNDGGEHWVGAEALSNLFRLLPNVNCVLLNACYSEEQADAIVTHVNYVIGMRQAIRDDAAIAFSKGFYRALGYGFSIEQAYEIGCNAIQLEISGSGNSRIRSASSEQQRRIEVAEAIKAISIPEHLKPILKKKKDQQRKPEVVDFEQTLAIPEHLKPILKKKKVLTLDSNHVGSILNETLPEEKELGLKQYRDRVREVLGDRRLSTLETIRLERLRKDLRLSETEANQILAEEQEPIRKAQDEYKAMLIRLIEAGHYPFDAVTQEELQAVRQELGLTDEEVEAIAPPILAAAEEKRRLNQFISEAKREEVPLKIDTSLEEATAPISRSSASVSRSPLVCSNCQSENSSNNRFCSECGNSFLDRKLSYVPISSTAAEKQKIKREGRSFVTVIGINEYEHFNKLGNAVNDAKGIQKALTEELGFSVNNSLFDNDATKSTIESLVEDDLPTILGENDSLILFFAGHGCTQTKKIVDQTLEVGYIAPVGANPQRWSSLIEVTWLLTRVGQLPAKHILVILDACHSGFALGEAKLNFRDEGNWRFKQDLLRKRSRRVITSSLRDQLAQDGGGPIPGHSLFTGHIINGLLHGEADTDKNGFITSSELGLFVRQKVSQATYSSQTPDFGSFHLDDRGEMVISLPD